VIGFSAIHTRKRGRIFSCTSGLRRRYHSPTSAEASNYFAHNFTQIHRTLRTSPAMAAGVTDHLWSVPDLVALWESE
jgi:hypothetical protein